MLTRLPERVHLVEVGPRDGLQNETTPVATADKFTFVRLLAAAGCREIELTSFVRPDAIPQLADARELVAEVKAHGFDTGIRFPCLVPNLRGIEAAHDAGITDVAVFVATSDAFSLRNINATVEESYERLGSVSAFAIAHKMRLRGYLSTVFGCPYEGDIATQKVIDGVNRLLDLGCYEVSLGDTIGIGTPLQVMRVLEALLMDIPASRLAMHFHDTRGLAISNILVSLELGITHFDASAGGLGGCPYARGASGNVATEDVVYLCEALGIDTGIDISKLATASHFMMTLLGRESPSKIHRILVQPS